MLPGRFIEVGRIAAVGFVVRWDLGSGKLCLKHDFVWATTSARRFCTRVIVAAREFDALFGLWGAPRSAGFASTIMLTCFTLFSQTSSSLSLYGGEPT